MDQFERKDSGLFVPVDLQKKSSSDAIEGIIRELRSMSLDDADSAFIVHLLATRSLRMCFGKSDDSGTTLKAIAEVIAEGGTSRLTDLLRALEDCQDKREKGHIKALLKDCRTEIIRVRSVMGSILREKVLGREDRSAEDTMNGMNQPDLIEISQIVETNQNRSTLNEMKLRTKPARRFVPHQADLVSIREEFPHFSQFIDEIGYQVESGNFSPVLLLGPSGVGKTYIQAALAAALRFPFYRVNVASEDSPFSFCGSNRGWRDAEVSELLRKLATENTDFMYVFLDEINSNLSDLQRNHPWGPVLLDFFDSSNRFRCNNLRHEFSTGNWVKIAAANDRSGLSKQLLDRFVVIEIKRPTNSQFRSIVKSMLVKAGLNYSSEAFEILSADPSSLRHLKRRIERLAHSAKNRLITEIDCARVLTD